MKKLLDRQSLNKYRVWLLFSLLITDDDNNGWDGAFPVEVCLSTYGFDEVVVQN